MLKDCKITRAIVNERRELSLNLLIKEGDYEELEHELFRLAKIEGNGIDLSLEGFKKSDNNEELKKLRQQLGIIMSDYAQNFHYDVQKVLSDLYTRKKVKSRIELSMEELQEEVESYRTAINTNTP